jgi:hypothetical protein
MRQIDMRSEVHRSRLTRPVVGIGIVVVIGAALGAVFGIRAVTGAGSASAPAQPSARTGAAMAYDAADQSIVLFGGQNRSRGLDDTWTWDGSAWTQQHPATSPPALDNVQMAYDPVSHDVLLVGSQEPAGVELPIACSSGSGSGSSGSSSSKTATVPPGAPIPDIAPIPSATGKAKAPTTVISSACGTSLAPRAATWLWNGSDWSKSAGTTPLVAFGSGTLALDPVAGHVVLLARGPFAEPAVNAAQPAMACPLQSAATPNGQPMCPFIPTVAPAWTWTGHEWKELTPAAGTSAFDLIGTSIIDDAVSGKLATFSGGDFIAPIPAPPTCEGCVTGAPQPAQSSACCTGTESIWSGTSWKEAATYKDGPFTSGVVFVGDPAAHNDVVLAGDGTTWVWTGTWKQLHPGTTPPIVSSAASAYDAATGEVVMFGGYGVTSHATGLYDQTWTWNGSDWTQRGGTSGPSVTIPVPSPVSVPPGLPCEPVVAPKAPLGAPVAQPQTTCNGVTGIGTGSTGSAGGVAAGGNGS